MKEISYPIGPKDTDSDIRSAQPHAFRRLKNMRYDDSEVEQKGVASAVRSTRIDAAPTIDFSQAFGRIEDPQTETVFRFVWYPLLGNVRIYRFNPNSFQDDLVLNVSQSLFGYVSGQMLTHGNVVNDMLIWVYPGAPIRKINIDKAIRHYQSSGTDPLGYSQINAAIINAGVRPPQAAPMASFVFDQSRKTSFLASSILQFAYRYRYDDKEVSTLSHYSRIVVPRRSWGPEGRVSGTEFETACDVIINTGNEKAVAIDLCVRTRNDSTTWRVIRKIDKSVESLGNNQAYTARIYGNESFDSLPDADLVNFYAMPITAECQDYTTENFLAWANGKVGQDKVQPSVSLAHERKRVGQPVEGAVELRMVRRNYNPSPLVNLFLGNDWHYGFVVIKEVPPPGSLISFRYSSRVAVGSISHDFPSGTSVMLVTEPSAGEFDLTFSTLPFSEGFKNIVFEYVVTDGDFLNGLDFFAENLRQAIASSYSSFRAAWNDDGVTDPAFIRLAEEVQPEIVDYSVAQPLFWPGDTNPSSYTGALVIKMTNDSNFVRLIDDEYFSSVVGFELDIADRFNTNQPLSVPPEFQGFAQAHYYAQKLETAGAENPVFSSFKSGAEAVFALNYFDEEKRDCAVVKSESMRLYVPFDLEPQQGDPYNVDHYLVNTINWEIFHKPPVWARSWSWVYKGSIGIQNFQRRSIVAFSITDEFVMYDLEANSINRLRGFTINHSPQKGDIVRVVRTSTLLAADYIEMTIVDVGTTDAGLQRIWMSRPSIELIPLTSNSQPGTLIEIITPALEDTEVNQFFEFGEDFLVLNPGTENRVHQGPTQNQTETLPATGVMTFGDVWVRPRIMGKEPGNATSNSQTYIIEDFSFSDYFESRANNRGRVAAFSEKGQRLRRTSVFRGEKYFQDTETNDLFRVSAVNEFILPETQGPINRLFSRGFTLKAYQTRKITSIYINREEVFYPDGASQLVLIDRVLGTARASTTDFGSSNPESFISDGNNIYFWDALNRTLVIDDMNGPDDIGVGIQGDLNVIGAQQDMFVLGGFDRNNGEILFCFRGKSSVLPVEICLAYHVKSRSFRSEYDYRPEVFTEMNNVFMSLLRDQVYTHDKGTSFLNIYGQQKQAEWAPIISPSAEIDKNFLALHIRSNIKPAAPEVRTSSGKRSSIATEQFEDDQQGFWIAPFNGNIDTPGLTPEQGLAYGDELDGQGLVAVIRFDSSAVRALVWSAVIEYTPSYLTP